MANCAIFGCPISRKEQYNHISLFKVTGEKDEYSIAWSRKLIDVITKTRVIDKKFRQLIESKRLWICEKHFLPNQVLHRKYFQLIVLLLVSV